jgi:hypothetical protein
VCNCSKACKSCNEFFAHLAETFAPDPELPVFLRSAGASSKCGQGAGALERCTRGTWTRGERVDRVQTLAAGPPQDACIRVAPGRSGLRGPRRRRELERHSPTRGGGSPKAPAGRTAALPSSPPFAALSVTIVSPRDSCCKRSQEASRVRLYAAARVGRAGWLPPKRSAKVRPAGEAAEDAPGR